MHLTLGPAQATAEEDIGLYTSNSLKHQAILGVSQPLPNARPFSSTGPQPIVGPFSPRISQPLPGVSPLMPSLPANSAQSTSIIPATTNRQVEPFYSPQTGSHISVLLPQPMPTPQAPSPMPLPQMPQRKNFTDVPLRVVIGFLLLLLLVIGSALAGNILLNRPTVI